MVLSSCNSEEPPAGPPLFNTSTYDGLGAANFYKRNKHLYTDTKKLEFASAAAGAAASIQAASHWIPPYYPEYNPQQASLPSNLELEINPFEIVGRNHNAVVGGILEFGGFPTAWQDFISYDTTLWRVLLMKDPEITMAEADSMISELIELDLNDSIAKGVEEVCSMTSFEELSQILGTTHEEKIYEVLDQYKDMKEGDASVFTVATYLNEEIEDAIEGFGEEWTDEDRALIIFLTVLKHSDCYWRE